MIETILGNKTNLRVFRYFSLFPNRFTTFSDILKNTNVGKSSLELSLKIFTYQGILISSTKTKRNRNYKLNLSNFFTKKLLDFFSNEKDKFQIVYPEVLSILASFESDCLKILDNVNDIILFGSYAKGNFNDKSDLDIVIIVEKYNTVDEIKLAQLVTKYEKKIQFQVFLKTKQEFKNELKNKNPLSQNILREGIILKN